MDTSWSVVRKVLEWANVVLGEVQSTMSDEIAKEDAQAAQKTVKRLLEHEKQAVKEASDRIQYQQLVRKLQAKEMPITQEQWRRSQRLD